MPPKPTRIVPSRVFVRRKMKLEGNDIELAKKYKWGYAMQTVDQEGESAWVIIFTNARTFRDNLTRTLAGERIENGQWVVDYSDNEDDENEEN